jgi:hypothetical protein
VLEQINNPSTLANSAWTQALISNVVIPGQFVLSVVCARVTQATRLNNAAIHFIIHLNLVTSQIGPFSGIGERLLWGIGIASEVLRRPLSVRALHQGNVLSAIASVPEDTHPFGAVAKYGRRYAAIGWRRVPRLDILPTCSENCVQQRRDRHALHCARSRRRSQDGHIYGQIGVLYIV